MKEKEDCRWEEFEDGCRVLTRGQHRFTTDTLLLAEFSMPGGREDCADLGTGCGAIPVLWRKRGNPGKILAVEISGEAAELARRSAEENGYSRDIEVICGDARDYKKLLPHQGLRLVACNPPYYPMNSGYFGEGERKTARHEESFTLQDLAKASRYTLNFGGRLCVCLPVERLPEAVKTFQETELEPKRLRMVQSKPEKGPYLFLLECRRGGRPGLTAEPALILSERSGAGEKEQ